MKRIVLIAVVLVVVASGAVFAGRLGIGPVVITRESEQKIVLRFSSPVRVTEPGFSLRLPLIDTVKTYERRVLYLNTEVLPIITKDRERLRVDNYVLWRIEDPVRFFAAFPSGQTLAEGQIDRIVRARVREVIAQHTLQEVLSFQRSELREAITKASHETLEVDGVEVMDVRINRTELPPGTETSVYARMKTDREALARKYRAEGEENARMIRAKADREAQVTVAIARRDAEIERGRGDAEAARIYGEAYEQDADFYAFLRSLEAYRGTLGNETTLVLSPDFEFFRYLGSPAAAPSP